MAGFRVGMLSSSVVLVAALTAKSSYPFAQDKLSMSLISAAAAALIERVEASRAFYAAEGLSPRAAETLISLGYWHLWRCPTNPGRMGPKRLASAARSLLRRTVILRCGKSYDYFGSTMTGPSEYNTLSTQSWKSGLD